MRRTQKRKAAVCDDADLTRGALTHRYPDLGGLLAAALARLHDEMLPSGTQPADTVHSNSVVHCGPSRPWVACHVASISRSG